MLVTPNASSYAVIPNPRGISLPGAFTIEFWALSSSFAPHAGLVEQANNGDTGAFSIGFTSGDSIGVSLRLNTGITNLATPNIADIQLWNHYAVTFTPGDSIRIYVNGILKASKKTTAVNLIASSDSIFIAYSELSKVVFTGNMDELRIWSVARTGAQIVATMKTSLSGKEAGLKAYYSFDDDPSTPNIHDFTGARSDGLILSSAVLAASTSPVTGTTASYMLASKESAIVFPELICGNQTDTIIRIFNRGQQTVQIDPVGFRFGTVFSASIIGFPLPPDSTHLGIIHIQANASKPGLYRDTLIVKSTTVCGGILLIPVELTVAKIAIAFQDSLFDLHSNLLPCNLPLQSQTFLKNTGTRTVTVNPLSFSAPAGIVITSPTTSFAIAAGASQEIKFTVQPDVSGPINTTLTATTNECAVSAKIVFKGARVDPQFSIPDHIDLPTVHLPATPTTIDTTIYLKNTGTSNLSMNPPLALLGSPGFRILSPLLAFIKPDSSFAIRIRFTTSRECGTFETSLHIQDQLDCSIDTLIPISITVLGPDVSASEGIFDLGANCGSHDTTIFLVNRSGLPIVVGKPNFSIDSVLFLQSGVLPKALDPGDSVPITLRFSPAEPGTYGVNAHFALYPCGDLNIHFKGTMGVGLIGLSDTTLNFWTGCDLSTETRRITITNQCGRPITITDTTSTGSHTFVVISPALPFELANNESKVITVQFTPQLLGSLEQGSIALFDSGCFVTRFDVRGVRERLTVQSNPSIAEFGTVCPGRMGTVGLSLQNLGYGDDTVTFYRIVEKGTSVFSATNAAGAVITHGNSRQFTVTFSPLDTGEFLGILELV
ncbi:MAG: choice-of-anchor D domain-containing protein, partial [Bacteroidota bacterium]|nr:choice-of-anchor D domain-containing protein [Bacteroidota bacterium]